MNKKHINWENILAAQIKAANVPKPKTQFKFCETRRWKSDFAWPDRKIIVEVEGGIWVNGRHTRAIGFQKDCEKYNAAALLGYRVFRVTPQHVSNHYAIELIKSLILY